MAKPAPSWPALRVAIGAAPETSEPDLASARSSFSSELGSHDGHRAPKGAPSGRCHGDRPRDELVGWVSERRAGVGHPIRGVGNRRVRWVGRFQWNARWGIEWVRLNESESTIRPLVGPLSAMCLAVTRPHPGLDGSGWPRCLPKRRQALSGDPTVQLHGHLIREGGL